MSDAERAAKAARAKAMLKKRQREKASATSATPNTGIGSSASPTEETETLSPALQEPFEVDKGDLGDVFIKDGTDSTDTSWLTSLPRAPSPPPRVISPLVSLPLPLTSSFISPPPSSPSQISQAPSQVYSPHASYSAEIEQLRESESRLRHSEASLAANQLRLNEEISQLKSSNVTLLSQTKHLQTTESRIRHTEALLEEQRAWRRDFENQLEELQVENRRALQNEQQTISLLVSEKSSLAAEVQRLEDFEAKAITLEGYLEAERETSATLSEKLQRLQSDQENATKLIKESQVREKDLTERSRDMERELHLATSSLNDLKEESQKHQRRVRELEEQIQSDDRVERLEVSLKNTQERADELEFQFTKLKQAHTVAKAERDTIDSERQQHAESVSKLEAQLTDLQGTHAGVLERFATVFSEKNRLAEEKAEVETDTRLTQNILSELQEKLAQAAATISSNSRQIQTVQGQLKAATRRAEDAEKTQKDLQVEGTNLLHSLDEMRPKIVELTGVKLELTETVNSLERELRNSQDTISHLETKLAGSSGEKENIEAQLQELVSQHKKDEALAMSDSTELQTAYTDIQEELRTTKASLHNLVSERESHRHEISHQQGEIDRLTSLARTEADEVLALREELDVARGARDEGNEFLERAQNEIETLRADLIARDDDIAQLREVVASPTHTNGGPRSLDDELINSLRQQHALDLSAAQSQIRALENSVFDANARAHVLQKQVSALEDQLTHPRSSSRLGQRSFSPTPSNLRPGSRNSDLRRSSFGSHRATGTGAAPLARSIFDQNMSAETRHKRLVSLSMLKARIDSEVEVTLSRPSSRASSVRALSPVQSTDGSQPGTSHSRMHSRSNSRTGHLGHRPQFLDESHVFWCHSCTGDLVIL